MSTDMQTTSGKPDKPLTRTDVEILLNKVNSSTQLNLSYSNLMGINLTNFDLTGANLQGTDLRSANLSNAILKKANLSNTNLANARLIEADLSEADLSGASLVNSVLNKAVLKETNLQAADLRGANLSYTDLRYTELKGTSLNLANLSDAILSEIDLERRILEGINFSGANLSRANLKDTTFLFTQLEDATLFEADLSGANLKYMNLNRTDLSRANLSLTNLQYSSLINADLNRATLTNATIHWAKLNNAILSKANFHNADLTGADLSGADLSGADLSGANLAGVNLSRTNLDQTNLLDANLKGTIHNETTLASSSQIESSSQYTNKASITRLLSTWITNIIKALFNLNKSHPPKNVNPSRIANKSTHLAEASFYGSSASSGIDRLTGMPITLSNYTTSNDANSLQIRIAKEPLTARDLINTIETFTELHTKLWLIKQNRLEDFLEYTNTRSDKFEEEANLIIKKLNYNSPLNIKFDIGARDIAEAIRTILDTFLQARHRAKTLELENIKKDLENKKLEIELHRQKIETELELANKVVDTLLPGADEKTKATYIGGLLPTLVKTENIDILEITLVTQNDTRALPEINQTIKVNPPSQETA